MKVKPYIEKLNNSTLFKKFSEKNPKAYFCAGFFVLDFDSGKNLHQIDYYLPDTKKMMTFHLDGEVEMKPSEASNAKTPPAIKREINLDLDTIRGLVEDEMKNRTVTNKIQKIIAIIQNQKGKLIWNLNCIASDMGVIKVHIDDETHSILKFEKINLFEVMKKI
ncbi:MAG: hypothetical protein WC533_02200 [Candidatus Pacearchaeota archaeon]